MKNTVSMFRLLLLRLLVLPMIANAQTETNELKSLGAKIKERLSSVEGKFAMAFKSVQDAEKALYMNENAIFHAASIMKVPVMVEVFSQAKAGKFLLSDSITVKNEFKSLVDGSSYKLNISDDSGEAMYGYIGGKMTVYGLVHQMITTSSNLATNILIEKVGAASIASTLVSIGAKDARVLRGVEDQKAFDKGWNNTVTAHDLLLIYEKMVRHELVSGPASKEMIKILLEQQFNSILPAKLPATLKVAHKTGEITGVQHDSGIVFMPDGRQYILILLSSRLKDKQQGIGALADVSGMIYEYMAKRIK